MSIETSAGVETIRTRCCITGGGPAGMTAALAAVRAGATVALIDEYAAPGGQIWRRRFDEVGQGAPASLPAPAARLCAELAASSVEVMRGPPLRPARAAGGGSSR